MTQGSKRSYANAVLGREVEDEYKDVTDPRVIAVLEVLAPRSEWDGARCPIFEWGHEETPTASEMIELAGELVDTLAATS